MHQRGYNHDAQLPECAAPRLWTSSVRLQLVLQGFERRNVRPVRQAGRGVQRHRRKWRSPLRSQPSLLERHVRETPPGWRGLRRRPAVLGVLRLREWSLPTTCLPCVSQRVPGRCGLVFGGCLGAVTSRPRALEPVIGTDLVCPQKPYQSLFFSLAPAAHRAPDESAPDGTTREHARRCQFKLRPLRPERIQTS